MPHNFPIHRYTHGKQKRVIALGTFSEMLKKVKRLHKKGSYYFIKYDVLTLQSLLAVLFWSGLRKTEVIGAKPHKYVLKPTKGPKHKELIEKLTAAIPGILKEDIELKGDTLFIRAVARKHGSREAPLELWVDFPFVELIIKQWKNTDKGERVWNLTEWDAWKIVKEIEEKKYPHFFRFNRISEMCLNPEMSMADICSWSGLTPQTIAKYMERSGRIIHSAATKMRKQYAKQF